MNGMKGSMGFSDLKPLRITNAMLAELREDHSGLESEQERERGKARQHANACLDWPLGKERERGWWVVSARLKLAAVLDRCESLEQACITVERIQEAG